MNRNDIKKLAQEIINSTQEADELIEAKSRMIIGRSYYCAYHVCIESKDIVFPKAKNGKPYSKHKFLIQAYQKSQCGIERKIGKHLKILRSMRNESDYDLSANVTFTKAKQCFRKLEKIIFLLDEVKESNLLAILTKNIFDHPDTKNLIELKNQEKLQTICKNNPDLDKFLFEHVIEVDEIYKPNKIIIQANDDKINIYPETKLTEDEISEKDKAFATWMSKRNYALDNLITYHK